MKETILIIAVLATTACAQRRVSATQLAPSPQPAIAAAPVPQPAPAARAEPARAPARAEAAARVRAALSGARAEHEYRRGTEHLDRREWEKAIEAFDRVAAGKGNRADGALYWKAYAQHKLGRRDEALATLAALQSAHANSRWLNDARQLEQEVRQATGQRLSPEKEVDEDLKLLALNALIQTEPERAVPLLEKLLMGNNPPKLKSRAMFVLAQTNWPKGAELLAKAARGGLNPDLQVTAVRYLGSHGGPQNAALLAEIYGSTQDETLKRAVLDAWSSMKEKDRLLAAAKSETSLELRRRAVHGLAEARATSELWQLYQAETAPEMRREMLHALYAGRAYDRIFEIIKTEKDPDVRRHAIRLAGNMRQDGAVELLRGLYASETDVKVRQEIIEALADQKQVQALIEIARKETEPALRKQAVHSLSRTKSKEANEFLLELLNK
jgi:HEAT repeat protein